MTTISDQLIFSAGEDAFDLTKLKLNNYVKYKYPFYTNGYSCIGVWFNSTGTKMLTVDAQFDCVSYYTLSPAWNLSSATFVKSMYLLTYLNVATVQGVCAKEDGTRIYFTDSTGDAVRQFDMTTPWDLSTIDPATAVSFTVNVADNLETAPYGLNFSTDGKELYVVGNALDTIMRYTLSTAWDISTATRTTVRTMTQFGIAAETSPTGVHLDSTGKKLYICGQTTDKVYQFSLSTAWDITTHTYVGEISIITNTAAIIGLFVSSDGTKLFTTDSTAGVKGINQYTLGTDWTVSTASYSTNLQNRGIIRSLYGISFNPTGTRCYLLDATAFWLSQHNLSTPWDITTATPVDPTGAQDKYLRAQDTGPVRVAFKPDGTRFYMLGSTNDGVYRYDMSTPWDISTATYINSKSIRQWSTTPVASTTATGASGQAIITVASTTGIVVGQLVTGTGVAADRWVTAINTTTKAVTLSANLTAAASGTYNFYFGVQSPSGLAFNATGSTLYVSCTTADYTYTWTMPSGSEWDITTATPSTRTNAITATETAIGEMVFNNDGTRVYCVGTTQDAVSQWDLTTPYDISTRTTASWRRYATYGVLDKISNSQLRVLGSAGSAPQSLAFSTDGSILYVGDDNHDAIWQMTLSTPWDIMTALEDDVKYLNLFDYNTSPTGVFIDDSGTRLYITDSASGYRYITQWQMSTPWQINTAVYSAQFQLTGIDTATTGIVLTPDGTKAFICGTTAIANATFGVVAGNDYAYQLTLSTPWDITTATLTGAFAFTQDTVPQDITFNYEGTIMYMVGSTGDAIYQYSFATPWDISTCSYTGLSKSVATEDTGPTGLYINKSGDKLYVCGGTSLANTTVNEGVGLFAGEEAVYQYTMTTPWNISTAVYDNVAYGVRRHTTSPQSVMFNLSGTEMYVISADSGGARIYQYPLYT